MGQSKIVCLQVLAESDRAGGSETLAVVPESPTKLVDTEGVVYSHTVTLAFLETNIIVELLCRSVFRGSSAFKS